jgi:alanyl-tRNA synthetase
MPDAIHSDVIARVDEVRRNEIKLHHTVTHLLHAALRIVLGTHVAQKGSLVQEKGMRFDFSHFAKMTEEELDQVSIIVNQKIRENIPVVIREMNKEEALMLGATALFGEKYGDKVRVVTIDPNYSVELCGGTHVSSTGALGYFMIVSEAGIAAGVRRIESICGQAADIKNAEIQALFKKVQVALKNPHDIIKAIEQQLDDTVVLKKLLEQTEFKLLTFLQKELLAKAEQIKGINFISDIIDVSSPEMLKKLCNDLRNGFSKTVVMLGTINAGKPHVAIGISDSLSADNSLDAITLIKSHVATSIKGGGGGQKVLATAGGQNPDGLKLAIQAVRKVLS